VGVNVSRERETTPRGISHYHLICRLNSTRQLHLVLRNQAIHESAFEGKPNAVQRAHAPASYLLAGRLIELRRIMFYVYGNSAGRKALLTITHVSHADRRAVRYVTFAQHFTIGRHGRQLEIYDLYTG